MQKNCLQCNKVFQKPITRSNGRTLCVDCHKKTDTWGGRASRILKETLWANAV